VFIACVNDTGGDKLLTGVNGYKLSPVLPVIKYRRCRFLGYKKCITGNNNTGDKLTPVSAGKLTHEENLKVENLVSDSI
jgi:hypothetical protein